MTDLHYFLALLTAAAIFYIPMTLRSTARRLHYRDRPLFWRAPLVLLTLAAAIAGAAAILLAFSAPERAGWLWGALILGGLGAAASWWMGLSPQQLVRHRA